MLHYNKTVIIFHRNLLFQKKNKINIHVDPVKRITFGKLYMKNSPGQFEMIKMRL